MKKARKSKFVIGGVALLSCVALAGVGYSSWVITSTINSKTGNVSVTAADVKDNRITIGDITVNGSYSFGPSTGGTLITATDSNESEEDLSASFSFTVSWASTLSKSYDITLALASDKKHGETDALAYAVDSAKYLTAPASGLIGDTGITIATVSSSGVTANSYSEGNLTVEVSTVTTSSATVTVTAAFGWGTYFDSKNPVNLSDSTKLNDYITGLQWLNTNLNEAEFTYTVG